MNRLSGWLVLSLVVLAVVLGCGQQQPAGLMAENARVRSLIAGSDKTVGYVNFTNYSTDAITLISARSDDVRTIEFHETTQLDGMMRMRRLTSVEIEADQSLVLQPGGMHLMLFGVKSLAESVSIEFTTATGLVIPVVFEVVDFRLPS